MMKVLMMAAALAAAMMMAGCNSYDVMYFNKDGTPYAHVKASLTDIGKITESTKGKSWIKWHNGVIVLGEVTISSESNGVPCFKGMFGDYDDGMAFFVEDQKDFEGMAKVVAAARRNSTTAKMDSSGMNVSNEKEKDRPKVWLPEKSSGDKSPAQASDKNKITVPELPTLPQPPAERPELPIVQSKS